MTATMKKFVFVISTGLICLFSSLSYAKWTDLKPSQMQDVVRIAKEISYLQPNLDEPKYIEYALGIYKASSKYGIDPEILIAITERETSFREDLPEGKAGELGICQIRKMWVHNKKFHKEFKHAVQKDLFHPSKSFMFAAWILKDLKMNANSNSLPFWSFYNAVRFEPRFRYFLTVNKNLAALRKYDLLARQDDGRIERVSAAIPDRTTPYSTMKINYTGPMEGVQANDQPVRFTRPQQKPVAAAVGISQASIGGTPGRTVAEEVASLRLSENSSQQVARWISDALARIQQQTQGNQNQEKKQPSLSPDLARTAQELGVTNYAPSSTLED